MSKRGSRLSSFIARAARHRGPLVVAKRHRISRYPLQWKGAPYKAKGPTGWTGTKQLAPVLVGRTPGRPLSLIARFAPEGVSVQHPRGG
ncbi:hypothetical protein THAOC_34896 [Thalassiosira oceanica]|uniref:Uncharacterized protein n=1 Tax=Thalassiosira oceanica TaxID=159749 RepID=K0RBG4_THAOC|nr:hypothetical protein THAOC_34896 [Thalassiosira oceanica]|eukprot:EJK46431.1 hypothetical protein THAOC_34896 [Thalassiosira oceanica]